MAWKAELLDRNMRILALRERGLTLRAIGEKVGLSAERVRHILCQHERQAKGYRPYYAIGADGMVRPIGYRIGQHGRAV